MSTVQIHINLKAMVINKKRWAYHDLASEILVQCKHLRQHHMEKISYKGKKTHLIITLESNKKHIRCSHFETTTT